MRCLSVFLVLIVFTLYLVNVNDGVNAAAACGRHGDPCSSDKECCTNMKCHRFANRCQVQITAEDLMAQRKKILERGSRTV